MDTEIHPIWTLDQGISVINYIRDDLAALYKYYPALAGSVMYAGKSFNDLDIILYAEHCHEDYRPALHYIIHKLNLIDFKAVEFEDDEFQQDHKLVFEGFYKAGLMQKKINFFIPSFSVGGKLDTYTVIYKDHNRS